MEKKILAISGRKQAGKDTCYKFLRSLLTNGESFPAMSTKIGHFYFADALKRMCIDILGCPEDKVYGTDDDKNTKVEHLLWENFPVPVFDMSDGTVRVGGLEDGHFEECASWSEWVYGVYSEVPDKKTPTGRPRRGPMTVRETLQFYGTEIFRRQYHDVWADACIRKIDRSDCDLAVITDCRFPNEVEASRKAGGKVIRLTRVVFPEDQHVSETSLDAGKYNWDLFDEVIDNCDISVEELCFRLYLTLRGWGWLPEIPILELQKFYQHAPN